MVGFSEKVHVVVRVRPLFNKKPDDPEPWVTCVDDTTVQTRNHRNAEQNLHYKFEQVYSPQGSQLSLYAGSVKPLIQHVLQGQNTSVLAYGPTGAGKTYTILGTPDEPGIIPRCVRDMFKMKKQHLSKKTKTDKEIKSIDVSFSYLEIYKEKVHDLLRPKSPPTDLPIREDQHHNIFVAGLSKQPIKDIDEFNEYFGPASKNRSTAMTRLNEQSSRSHSVLLLEVTTKHSGGTRVGKMYIIDLAGSEDNRRTGNQGVRLKESGAINSSLLALSQVVDALDKGLTCVPYRGSKLTRLLQDSLGGNAHSCMIVNLAPDESYYFETYQTLNFARKAKKIVNVVKTNENPDVKTQIPMDVKTQSLKRPASTEAVNLPSTPPKKMAKTESVTSLSPLLRQHKQFQDDFIQQFDELKRSLKQSLHPDNVAVYQDETVTSTESLPIDQKPVKSRKREKNGDGKSASKKKDNLEEAMVALRDVSNNALFLKHPTFKRKGFKSTAAGAPITESSEEDTSPSNCGIDQQAHNDKILATLNSGRLADVKKLQTVGPKRAAMIVQWTELNNKFTTFDDLKHAGISRAGLQTFLQKNLVKVDET